MGCGGGGLRGLRFAHIGCAALGWSVIDETVLRQGRSRIDTAEARRGKWHREWRTKLGLVGGNALFIFLPEGDGLLAMCGPFLSRRDETEMRNPGQ